MRPILGQNPAAREPAITFQTDGDQLWYALLDTTGRLRGYFTGGLFTTGDGVRKDSGEGRTTRTATFWYVAGDGREGPARLY